MKSDKAVVDDRDVELNGDGTFTGLDSVEACGDKPHRVDISDGWNFMMCLYRSGKAILKRECELPDGCAGAVAKFEPMASSWRVAARIARAREWGCPLPGEGKVSRYGRFGGAMLPFTDL
ncbi:hypothetical protein [Sinorhizobium sp. A49]|uniref:hypothetical protein n=1 Tax=Sinorhizobium sp. A49 TaxID=1945861 RepID=UPI0011157A2E|nr:hypothetical protein [Sinorhizobium sp. A49]